jgi:hypothetical protein
VNVRKTRIIIETPILENFKPDSGVTKRAIIEAAPVIAAHHQRKKD